MIGWNAKNSLFCDAYLLICVKATQPKQKHLKAPMDKTLWLLGGDCVPKPPMKGRLLCTVVGRSSKAKETNKTTKHTDTFKATPFNPLQHRGAFVGLWTCMQTKKYIVCRTNTTDVGNQVLHIRHAQQTWAFCILRTSSEWGAKGQKQHL